MDTDERRTIAASSADAMPDDVALRVLTPEDRERLAMDAWEPSLLRKLLEAENGLPFSRPGARPRAR